MRGRAAGGVDKARPAAPSDPAGAARLLADPDMEVRGEAFAALVSDPGASAALEGACRSPDARVRAFAALAVGNRGERGVLLEMASDPEAAVRSCALGALAHAGAPGARGAALAALSDGEAGVRRAAVEACAKMGVPVPEADIARLESEGDGEALLLAGLARRAAKR